MHTSDQRGCDGVSGLQSGENINSLSFLWQPLQRSTAIVSVKVNCLSSEFAAKKHGELVGVLTFTVVSVSIPSST